MIIRKKYSNSGRNKEGVNSKYTRTVALLLLSFFFVVVWIFLHIYVLSKNISLVSNLLALFQILLRPL